MGPEGELRLGLHLGAGAVMRVDIESTRPDVARSMLQGRRRTEVAAVVPLLFSICGRSQAAASELACAAAAGEPISPARFEQRRLAVAAETLREGSWRVLLDWPQSLGERPAEQALAAARASLAGGPAEPAESAATANAAIAMAVYGVPAQEWLAIDSQADLTRWARTGRTASARFIRRVQDGDAATAATAASAAAPAVGEGEPTLAPFLPAHDHAAWMGEVASAIDADGGFERQPTWRGLPAETGALARLQADPLLGDLTAHTASRVQARFVARLRELALLLVGRSLPAVGALGLGGNGAISWVETARGLLVHRVTVRDDRAHHYRIVAPTEWNFHPRGALALALAGAHAADPGAARQAAMRMAASLDPCVACRVEVVNA